MIIPNSSFPLDRERTIYRFSQKRRTRERRNPWWFSGYSFAQISPLLWSFSRFWSSFETEVLNEEEILYPTHPVLLQPPTTHLPCILQRFWHTLSHASISRGIEWSLRAFASTRAVRSYLRARAVIKFVLRAASTSENTDGEQRAPRKFSAGWNHSFKLKGKVVLRQVIWLTLPNSGH